MNFRGAAPSFAVSRLAVEVAAAGPKAIAAVPGDLRPYRDLRFSMWLLSSGTRPSAQMRREWPLCIQAVGDGARNRAALGHTASLQPQPHVQILPQPHLERVDHHHEPEDTTCPSPDCGQSRQYAVP